MECPLYKGIKLHGYKNCYHSIFTQSFQNRSGYCLLWIPSKSWHSSSIYISCLIYNIFINASLMSLKTENIFKATKVIMEANTTVYHSWTEFQVLLLQGELKLKAYHFVSLTMWVISWEMTVETLCLFVGLEFSLSYRRFVSRKVITPQCSIAPDTKSGIATMSKNEKKN